MSSNPQSPGAHSKFRRSWFDKRPELLEEVRQSLASDPNLHLIIEDGMAYVRGALIIKDENYVLDQFQVEIKFPVNYPQTLPEVREVSSKIPRIPDRHINGDGTACVCVPEEWMALRPDPSFASFLAGPVSNFFLSQSYFEAKKEWPFGERPHGNDGMLQVYSEVLKTQDKKTIKLYLTYLARKKIKGHWRCPCGSKKRLRHCHFAELLALRDKLPSNMASCAFNQIFPKEKKRS